MLSPNEPENFDPIILFSLLQNGVCCIMAPEFSYAVHENRSPFLETRKMCPLLTAFPLVGCTAKIS